MKKQLLLELKTQRIKNVPIIWLMKKKMKKRISRQKVEMK